MRNERLQALQEAVRALLKVKAEKKEVTKDFNDRISALEERIEVLSDRIEEDKHQQPLPFDRNLSVTFDEAS